MVIRRARSMIVESIAVLAVTAIVLATAEGLQAAESQPARAGGERAGPDSSTGPQSGADSESVLEVVLVTAQKREERLQDVPISMTAIGSAEIERRRFINAEDYLRGIPGVNQTENFGGQTITIRGLETAPNNQNFFTGTTVATYFGETPTTNSGGLTGGTNVDIKLVDIERVEVLRGPQGTAFGSSSLGGAVRTIPVAPKLNDFEGKVTAGYSITSGFGSNNYNLQGIANIPLVADKLAIRATAYKFDESGYYRNVSLSDPTPGFLAMVENNQVQDFVTDRDDIGAYQVIGGRIGALFQVSDDLSFSLTYLSQKNERNGMPVATSGTYTQEGIQLAPELHFRGQDLGRYDTDVDLANAVMEYDFGWATVLATYSHIESVTGNSFERSMAFAQDLPYSFDTSSGHGENVGEVRFTTQLDGRWNFLAGGYVEDIEDDYLSRVIWVGAPAMNPWGSDRLFGTRADERTLEQKAAFAEVSWQMVEGLTLTGGVRAYDYDRSIQVATTGQVYNGAGLKDTVLVDYKESSASGEIYRLNLSYKPNSETLLYGSFSQGFRLGNSQLGLPVGSCDLDEDGIVDGTDVTIESTQAIGPDSVDNYELGLKFAALNRRLTVDAAVFRMNWDGLPFSARLFEPGGSSICTNTYLANVSSAVSEGVEFQLVWQVSDEFRVDLSGSWLDARLAVDKPPPAPAEKGSKLPSAPEYNGSLGLQYEFDLASYRSYVRLDSVYVGSSYGEIQNLPQSKVDDYMKFDASAGVQLGSLGLSLFVQNLTNEDAFVFRNTFSGAPTLARFVDYYGYRLRPRTMGLQLSYAF